jgi:hypothetical protein
MWKSAAPRTTILTHNHTSLALGFWPALLPRLTREFVPPRAVLTCSFHVGVVFVSCRCLTTAGKIAVISNGVSQALYIHVIWQVDVAESSRRRIEAAWKWMSYAATPGGVKVGQGFLSTTKSPGRPPSGEMHCDWRNNTLRAKSPGTVPDKS